MSTGLKTFRKLHRIQLQELARAAGVSVSLLSRIENGWADASPATLAALDAGYKSFGIAMDADLKSGRGSISQTSARRRSRTASRTGGAK